ncbi:MAG TPA: hypothetical protein VF058_02395, partial [Actinomycetota bacterium]
MRGSIAMAVAAVLILAAAVRAQQPVIPPGYTAYRISGPGISGVPPLPFRIEGDRLVAPEGSLVSVTASALTADRVRLSLVTPDGPATFVGLRDGEAFAGFLLQEGEQRWAMPMTFVPAGQETALAPDTGLLGSGEGVSRVEIVPANVTLRSNEQRAFVARVYDESGAEVADADVEWFAFGGTITEEGDFHALNAGERQVVALVNGTAIGTTTVIVEEPAITSLTVWPEVPSRLAVGSRVVLEVDALTAIGRWDLDPAVVLESSAPSVVGVEGWTLAALSPGRAQVTLSAGEARESWSIEVVAASGALSITGVPTGAVRTGDVVRLGTTVADAVPLWAVAEAGAEVWPDGAFVAERAGTYTVLATLGDEVAEARVAVESRGLSGRIRIQGHGTNVGTYTSDLWPQSGYVYVGTHQANQLRTYDVSDPTSPVLTDSQAFDARVVNDVKVSEDGKWLVATREGASDRRNGILVFSLSDPSHPELVSEYTETLTSGVHNVFWVGSLVYAVNDGTGDLHIIDVSDPASPREVGRWGLPVEGRSLHDVWVQEGVAYLSYLRDGLVIVDVG